MAKSSQAGFGLGVGGEGFGMAIRSRLHGRVLNETIAPNELGGECMKPSLAKWVKIVLTALVVAPLLTSLAWRQAAVACDYISQGALLLLMLALPFCSAADASFIKHFAPIFLTGVAWGVWRFGYFDPVTRNDVPGIGYLFVPFMMVAISAGVLVLRGWLSGGVSKKAP